MLGSVCPLCVFELMHTVYPLPPASPVLCLGTKNGLSLTGSTEEQYKRHKDMYTGCEIVMGNLEITHMEHSRNLSFLQVRLQCEMHLCLSVVENI